MEQVLCSNRKDAEQGGSGLDKPEKRELAKQRETYAERGMAIHKL